MISPELRSNLGPVALNPNGKDFGVYSPIVPNSPYTSRVTGSRINKEVGVKLQVRSWRLVARVVIIALVLAAIPLPGLAEESTQPNAAPGLRASIAKAAANTKVSPSQGQKAATPDKAALGSKSFFKTPAGMIVLAVVAAGSGYAIYSAGKDRIHSVVRDAQ
jgi:hypothetical protein